MFVKNNIPKSSSTKNMTQSGFIAVIDLGTSRIKGVVGSKELSDNVISILHQFGSIDSGQFYSQGSGV